MRLDGLRTYWLFPALCVGVTALCVSLASWHDGTAQEGGTVPAKVATEHLAAGTDLTDRVELELPDALLRSGRTDYHVTAKITNDSDEPLQGPILLLIEGTGIDGLAVQNADGRLVSGEFFLKFVADDDQLAPEASTQTRRVAFQSEDPLRFAQRRQFELDYKIVQAVAAQENRRVTSRNTPTPGWANPGAPGADRGTNATGRQADQETSQPAPATERQPDEMAGPNGFPTEPPDPEEVQRVMNIQNESTERLMAVEGVQGTATGINQKGEVVVRVYAERHGIRRELPEEIDGVPVEVRVTGKIRLLQPPQDKRAQGGIARPRPRLPAADDSDFEPRHERPIPIGSSVAHFDISAGTIGFRLKSEDGRFFMLSNNHVLAGWPPATVAIGDNIVHPGPVDGGVDPDDIIGTLAAFIPVVRPIVDPDDETVVGGVNRVDAAIAEVTPEVVGRGTVSAGYGVPNSHIVQPALLMKVQKVGRTTGFTTGMVTGLNVTIPVVGDDGGVFEFVNQIEISNPLRPDPITGVAALDPFGAPGDSGSGIVTNPHKNPVGLLFAGTPFGLVFANPIDMVLEELGDAIGQRLEIDGEASNAGSGG